MAVCPYCGAEAATVQEEIEHMNGVHPQIVTERLREAGFGWDEIARISPIDRRQIPREAVQAAVKLLWDKRAMLPENSEEIVEDVLLAAMPYLTRKS